MSCMDPGQLCQGTCCSSLTSQQSAILVAETTVFRHRLSLHLKLPRGLMVSLDDHPLPDEDLAMARNGLLPDLAYALSLSLPLCGEKRGFRPFTRVLPARSGLSSLMVRIGVSHLRASRDHNLYIVTLNLYVPPAHCFRLIVAYR